MFTNRERLISQKFFSEARVPFTCYCCDDSTACQQQQQQQQQHGGTSRHIIFRRYTTF
jgi:hypothetical protein